jgi:hypothetical protein
LGQCIAKVGPSSYLIQNESGQKFKRNRKFLRTTEEQESQPVKPQKIATTVPEVSSCGKNADTATTKAKHKRNTTTTMTSPAEKPPALSVPVKAEPVKTRTRSIKPPANFKDYVTTHKECV